MTNPFNINLDKNEANYQPLTPLFFLQRTANVFPNHTAIIHGNRRYDYATFYRRSLQLASALSQKDIGVGDTVSAVLANTPAMLEAHYGVPMSGAVLHSINPRLDAKVIAFQLDHANSKVLIVDREYSNLVKEALSMTEVKPLVIDYNDLEFPQEAQAISDLDYEDFIANGDAHFKWVIPSDEWDAITLNYTSGTTGNPKGVVYHHRGAYLLAQGNALVSAMQKYSVYLWTLPMFHCNGWCFPWTMSLVVGTHVCLRKVRGDFIWDALENHQVTHLSGAPIVMDMILAESENRQELPQSVEFFTAAAPPPEKCLADMNALGFQVTHLYGLTETYGPAVVNEWNYEWNALDSTEKAKVKARQGVNYPCLEALEVVDPETMEPVPHDGETIGEVMFKGNVVMKGYLKNKEATDEAFSHGWFHSGDLAVVHNDGYIQLKDRSKDIIISGGENISSIEIEEVLYKHPSVHAAAVVALSDDKWGEVPCAFVELVKDSQTVTAEDIQNWCRQHLASFKMPKRVIFEPIIKTSTGKVQKFLLRDRAEEVAKTEKKVQA